MITNLTNPRKYVSIIIHLHQNQLQRLDSFRFFHDLLERFQIVPLPTSEQVLNGIEFLSCCLFMDLTHAVNNENMKKRLNHWTINSAGLPQPRYIFLFLKENVAFFRESL